MGFTQISLGAHSNPISFLGIHTDIPGRTQQPDLFFLGFTQISPGAHSYPIFFFFFFFFFFLGIHTDIPRRTQQPDLFFLGFTQISQGAHSYPISFFSFFSFFFFFFFWDSHRYPWAHTATRSFFLGIHTDIPGRTQQPDLFFLGFTQISLGAHSNPISFSWDSHRYPRVHTATRSLFLGIHTEIPGRTQLPDLFSLGFTQISPGAHSNPISFSWDSHRYPWAHTATRSFFFLFFFFLGIHTDIPGRTQQPDLFFLGFTQISPGAHSYPISFPWDSHRTPFLPWEQKYPKDRETCISLLKTNTNKSRL